MKKRISVVSTCHNHINYLNDWFSGLISQLKTLDHDKYELEISLVIDEINEKESWNTSLNLWKWRWEECTENCYLNCKYFARNNNFKIYINSTNEGGAASLTTAIERCTGDYIAYLDCDDYYKPNKIQRTMEFIEANALDGAHTDLDCILPSGEYREDAWSKTCWQEDIVTFERLKQMNTIYTCTFLCKSEFIRQAPTPLEFSKHFQHLGDYPLFLTLVKNGCKIGWLNESLSVYRDSVGIHNKDRDLAVALDAKVRDWANRGCPELC